MTAVALLLLVATTALGLIAGQGLDGYGFWTTLLWMTAAVTATLTVTVNTDSASSPLSFTYFMAGFAAIATIANFRIHSSSRRFLADIYTVTIGPAHFLIWVLMAIPAMVTQGSRTHAIKHPWTIFDYKPSLSPSRMSSIERKKERLGHVIHRATKGK
ncbi:hypothetical protein ACT3SZ_01590 [Corynebacterium sp. AOP40-9SA-29]|uniref:hypothetical protein n=1 Tax=Corynebacterium sp. AOP40-9SA-29 TaxID=3457677 RepID=UPI0040334EB1